MDEENAEMLYIQEALVSLQQLRRAWRQARHREQAPWILTYTQMLKKNLLEVDRVKFTRCWKEKQDLRAGKERVQQHKA